jgi:hypothetical protein
MSTRVAARVANVTGDEEERRPIRVVDQDDIQSDDDEQEGAPLSEKRSHVRRQDTEVILEQGYGNALVESPAGELEGRTLGVFGPQNPLRKGLSRILLYA